MKLIIQIPCYNDAATLGITLSHLPRTVPGVDCVEWLVVDDGSEDETPEVAAAFGADHLLRLPNHVGLARAFAAGLEASLQLGADLIVHTDADNQYSAADIPGLIAPLLEDRADLVVGARPINQIAHFSWLKKRLQHWGSFVVRMASNTSVLDATSGFRAFNRTAASRLQVFGDYTYTLETLIQAGQQRLRVRSVPVRTNEDLRPSRLIQSLPGYVARAGFSILRTFVIYRPLSAFGWLGGMFLGVSGLSLLANLATNSLPLLLLSIALATIGLGSWLLGLCAEVVSANRKLCEQLLARVRELEERQTAGTSAQVYSLRVSRGSPSRLAS